MGRSRRGLRDGTGPRKGSFMQRTTGKGRRQLAGLKCPARRKK